MSEHYSQDRACIELFTHLQALEYSLSQGRRAKITRATDKAIHFSVHSIGESKAKYSIRIATANFHNIDTITNTIAIIKQDLIDRKLIYPAN